MNPGGILDLARLIEIENQVGSTVKKWKELGQYLIIKYKDGNVMREKDGQFERNV
jgi:hypothetical protein